MISIPGEIIEEIVLRLPVKSILRFRSVSKPWLSRISHPSFTKLHLTRAHRTAFFISAYDYSSHKRHLFCAAHDGGPVTHLLTLGHEYFDGYAKAQHLNGLVLFTCVLVNTDHAFVINPSTRKIYKLPDPTFEKFYVFGFDESINEHKILLIRKHVKYLNKVEIMIFSLSNYSWRIINAQPPGPDVALSCYPFHYGTECSVCVNSVVHLTLDTSDILAFDLRTEKVSIITTPQGVAPCLPNSKPSIIKINGCVGFVCHDRVMERNELHIWILQDYENRVWVKEIITFPQPWIGLGCTFPLDVYKDEIIFTPSRLSRKHSAPIYNKKSRCLKSVRFTFGDEIIKCSKTVQFDQIKCYVESMTPL